MKTKHIKVEYKNTQLISNLGHHFGKKMNFARISFISILIMQSSIAINLCCFLCEIENFSFTAHFFTSFFSPSIHQRTDIKI